MSKQFYLPESMHEIDSTMDRQKLLSIYKNNQSIIGKITRLNSKDQVFEVNLGGGLIGIMPVEYSTIYQIYKGDNKFSYNIITLVGKIIQAKIMSLDNNIILLSRKENMLEAIEVIKELSEINFASITSFSTASAFIDIGAGILGRCFTYNFANTIFKDAKDVGFKKGDIIPVKIIAFQNEINCFELSAVDTFSRLPDILNEKDIVTCKVFGSLEDGIGYYVLIDNKYVGIVDSPFYKLMYGNEISAIIRRMTDKGPRLKLVEKL